MLPAELHIFRAATEGILSVRKMDAGILEGVQIEKELVGGRGGKGNDSGATDGGTEGASKEATATSGGASPLPRSVIIRTAMIALIGGCAVVASLVICWWRRLLPDLAHPAADSGGWHSGIC